MGQAQSSQDKLANPQVVRNVSDKLDSVFWKDGYKDTSESRALVHGAWHAGAAVARGGHAGEWARAQEQFSRVDCSRWVYNDPFTDPCGQK